jgi:hypothetical protein
MRNKIILSVVFIFTLSLQLTLAQSAGEFFNKAARSYVKTEKDQALSTVNTGLSKYPSDAKLRALKEKLKQDQEKEKEEQEQKDQEKQSQEQQEQESKDKGEKTKEDEAKESQKGDATDKSQDPPSKDTNDQMDANLGDRQKAMEEFKEKLKAMNLTPEQAAQILESMNAAELRYIQQNKKKPTERPKRGIPDW